MKKIFLLLLLLITTGVTSVFAETIKVRVTSSKPIYEKALVRTPHTYYQDVEVEVPYNCGRQHVNRNEIGLDTVVGSVLGVAIGNQIGRKNGRTVAKIAGGLGGGYIANQMRQGERKNCYRKDIVRKKFTDYSYDEVRQLIGYRNCGYIGSKQICTETKTKQRYIYLDTRY